MLLKIFQSLPQQTRAGRSLSDVPDLATSYEKENINKLKSLGFSPKDCSIALEKCNGRLEPAALWLTENSVQESYTSDFKLQTEDNQRDNQSKSFETLQVCIRID